MSEQASELKPQSLNGDARPHRESSLVERLAAEARKDAANGEASPSAMAERFAPLPEDWMDESAGTATPLEAAGYPYAVRRSSFSPALLAALILLALIPSALLIVLLAQGVVRIPGADVLWASATQRQPVAAASLAGPTPKIAAPKAARDVPAIVLTAPDRLEGTPGEDIEFGLAVDSTDALPARSVIAIRNLPEGATLSQGRPYGATEWTLRPDEIGDLRLALPAAARGEANIRSDLVAADGKVLASAGTVVTIFDPRAGLVVRPQESARVDDLIEHGKKMISVGYFAGARAYFKRAAEAGSAEAALSVGATYDPVFIEQIGAQGIKPEPDQARIWYERAKLLGLSDPDAQIAELREAFEAAGAHEVEEASEPALPASAETEAEPEWVELSGSANMREGPSSNAKTMRTAMRGTKFHAIGRKGNWIQVTDPDTKEIGWIYARYIATAELR